MKKPRFRRLLLLVLAGSAACPGLFRGDAASGGTVPRFLSVRMGPGIAAASEDPDSGSRPRRLRIEGTISGDFRGGNLRLGETSVVMEGIGRFAAEGSVVEWGKEGVSGTVRIEAVSLEELGRVLKQPLPLEGTASGVLKVSDLKPDGTGIVDFDVAVEGFRHRQGKKGCRATLRGRLDAGSRSVRIDHGVLEGREGSRVFLQGTMEGQDLRLSVDASDLAVGSLLELAPEPMLRAWGIADVEGTLTAREFIFTRSAGRVAVEGMLSLVLHRLSVRGVSLKGVRIVLTGGGVPSVNLRCERAVFAGLAASNVAVNLRGYSPGEGEAEFRFCGGTGNCRLSMDLLSERFSVQSSFLLKGMNLAALFASLNETIRVEGNVNIEGVFGYSGKSPELEMTVRSVPKKGVSQQLNLEAVNALMAAAGQGEWLKKKAIGIFARTSFGYRQLAGKVTLREGWLTLEGLAGGQGTNRYLLRGTPLQGVNILVSATSNTIRLEDFRKRIENALDTL